MVFYTTKTKVLIIAPHPDDEVLGCGGTIKKYTNLGNEVSLCVVTKAYTPDWSEEFIRNRPNEIKKASEILGIKKIYHLGYPTAMLDTISQKKLNDSIYDVIKKTKPDTVFIPHNGDISKDHQIVSESSLVAIRPMLNHKIKQLMFYEVLSVTEFGQQIKIFNPNLYFNISETFDTKIEAMKIYNSELKYPSHPRSIEIIKAHAMKRGSEVNIKYAEAFTLIRGII